MKIDLTRAMEAPETVAIDLETTGLDWVRDTPLLMGIYGKDFEGYFNIFEYPKDQLDWFFKDFLKNRSVILHNAKFDFHFIRRYCDVSDVIFADTMILSQLVDENTRHGLEDLSIHYFGENACIAKKRVDDIISDMKRRRKNSSFSIVPNDLLGDRAIEDSKNTFNLYRILRNSLSSEDTYLLEKKVLKALLIVEENGVLIDTNYLNDLKIKLNDELNQIKSKYPDINLESAKQVREELFINRKIKPAMYTKLGTPSVSEKVLEIMDNEFAKDTVQYRTLLHTISTYIDSFLERVDEKSRLHCSFNQLGATTSRLSCVEPNLQQIPRDGLIKQAFIGSKNICSFDYSQMEAVLYALFRQEEFLLKSLENNIDVYTTMASELYGKSGDSISKDERKKAKDIFLGVLYGMGQKTLTERFPDISISDLRRTFPKLDGFRNEVILSLMKRKYVETIFGHKRHLSLRDAYKGVNSIIQGSAAGILKQSIISLPPSLLNKLRITVHDENVFENVEEEECLQIVKTMSQYNPLLKVKVGKGKNWHEANENGELFVYKPVEQ